MSSDLSFAGSCEFDLIKSKYWLCWHLPRRNYGRIYVLGSWYGNLGLILRGMNFKFKHIINVEQNSKYCKDNELVYKLADFDVPYTVLNKDCNKIDYNAPDLVINTSTNDIKGHDWFERIPSGCTVALQCRNNQLDSDQKNRPDSFSEFTQQFKFKKLIYRGKLDLKNTEELYQRYTVIGIK